MCAALFAYSDILYMDCYIKYEEFFGSNHHMHMLFNLSVFGYVLSSFK